MTATLRRLTDSERAAYLATPRAVTRAQARVRAAGVQCDRCEHAAETVAVSADALDCVCYACYPAFHAESAAAARAAARNLFSGLTA